MNDIEFIDHKKYILENLPLQMLQVSILVTQFF